MIAGTHFVRMRAQLGAPQLEQDARNAVHVAERQHHPRSLRMRGGHPPGHAVQSLPQQLDVLSQLRDGASDVSVPTYDFVTQCARHLPS